MPHNSTLPLFCRRCKQTLPRDAFDLHHSGSGRYYHHCRTCRGAEYVVEDRGYTTPCWIWQQAIHKQTGYGLSSAHGVNIWAHRMMYERHHGAVPADMHLDHLCRVRACCNPDHLEPVTVAENNRRMYAAAKAAGVDRGFTTARFTADQVREMRRMRAAGLPYTTIGKRFGCHRSTARQVVIGLTYGHIT